MRVIQIYTPTMKRILLSAAITAFAMTSALAQNPVYKGSMFGNANLGFSNHGVPVGIGIDFGVDHNFTLGIEAAYRFNYDGSWGLGGNTNYHFNKLLNLPPNYDFYAGVNVGATFGCSNDSGVDLGAQIGGRIFINETWGVNLQFGGGNNFNGGRAGITIKL